MVIAGREHALQAFGLAVACVHPHSGDVGHEVAEEAHHPEHRETERAAVASPLLDDGGDVATASPDVDDADECPIGCSSCACGAATFALPAGFTLARRGWLEETFGPGRGRDGPRACTSSLDRPPRPLA
jgi:hypothetical protein